jgi:hypothetical protein
VRNRTGLEEEYLGASNGIAGAKLPLPPEDRQYPEHDKLIEHIMDLVGGNIEAGRDCMHAREMLDDILVDLTYLKNAIGTPEQYLKKGKVDLIDMSATHVEKTGENRHVIRTGGFDRPIMSPPAKGTGV